MPTIRQATIQDAEVLADLAARAFVAAYAAELAGDELDRFAARTFSPDRIRAELGRATITYLLAYDEADLVGYAMVRKADRPACVVGRRPLELARIYLEASAIGRGYGAALMQACLDVAQAGGYETLWLGVWEHNARAIGFYERWGFTVVGSQTFEFGGELQTDLVMVRPVADPKAERDYGQED